MNKIKVKNFELFQHYKDRNPPWIKLHYETLDDYDFAALPDAAKWHLVAIWLLASRTQNATEADPAWIARRINATEKVDLALLQKLGFIQSIEPCSKLLAERKQSAMPETETQVETEKKERPPLVPPAGGNPKERSVVRRNKTRIPDDWCFDPAARQIFLDAGISYSLEQPAFRDHHAAAGSLFLDWDAAGRKWARNAVKFAAERSGNQRQRTGPGRAVGLAEAMADVLATGAGKAQRAGDPGASGDGNPAMPTGGRKPGENWDGPSIDVVDLGGGAFGVPAGRGDDSPQDVGEDREMVADAGGDPIGVHVAGGAQAADAANPRLDIPAFMRRG